MDWNVSLLETSVGVTLLIVSISYYYFTKYFNYWKQYNVAGPRPIPIFGNLKDSILGEVSSTDVFKSLYDAYPSERAVGFFMIREPVLLVRDLDMLKDILIKNFSAFADRGPRINKDVDPLAYNIIFMESDKWRPLRSSFTPMFTSGKLKDMFYLVNECGQNFEAYLRKLANEDQIVNCQELTAKYTTDVIGCCAFGLNMDTLLEEESDFCRYGRLYFESNWRNSIQTFSRQCPKWMGPILRPFGRNDELIDFFVGIMRNAMTYRKENNARRNDFVDLLMDIKDDPDKVNGANMTDIAVTAQAFAIYTAGFETTSNALSHALYELALNPRIQDRLREEINSTFKDNGQEWSYDSVKSMQYLDKVIKETLRKYPPFTTLARRATSDHVLDGIPMRKGMLVVMPIHAIHHDPRYYLEPERFDPERFSEASVNARPRMSYLPFGEGPRNCIGLRFAQIQTKLGLVYLLRNCKFQVCEKTFTNYVKQPNVLVLVPKGGIHLKMNAV